MEDIYIDLSRKKGRKFYADLYKSGEVPNPPYYDLEVTAEPFIEDRYNYFIKNRSYNINASKIINKEPLPIDIIFEGRKEALEVIDTGRDIIEYLTDTKSKICPLIGSEIKLDKMLGKGGFGAAFEVDFGGTGSRKFVAKKVEIYLDHYKVRENNRKYGEYLKNTAHLSKISADIVLKYLGKKGSDLIPKGTILRFPEFLADMCREDTRYKRTDGKGYTEVPKGSLICDNKLTEYIISLLLSELYRKGISINFLDVFAFAVCKETEKDTNQYTFMEKITTSVRKFKSKDIRSKGYLKVADYIYFQVVHALAVAQNYLNFVHGDLHDENVFLLEVTNELKWEGQTLEDKSYFEYKVEKKSFYLDYTKSDFPIVKIGDLGLSVIYQKGRIIGDKQTLEDGYNQGDKYGPWLPNFYSKSYDLLFFTYAMYKKHYTPYIESVLMWMLKAENKDDLAKKTEEYFNPSFRPILNKMTEDLNHVTPIALLNNDKLMSSFKSKPKGSGIVLGTI